MKLQQCRGSFEGSKTWFAEFVSKLFIIRREWKGRSGDCFRMVVARHRQAENSAIDLIVVLVVASQFLIFAMMCVFYQSCGNKRLQVQPSSNPQMESVYHRAGSMFGRLFQFPSSELLWNELTEKVISKPRSNRKLDCVSGAFDLTQETSIFYCGSNMQNHAVAKTSHSEYYFSSEVQNYLESHQKLNALQPTFLPTIRESKSRESLTTFSRSMLNMESGDSLSRRLKNIQRREIVVFAGQQQQDRKKWLLGSSSYSDDDDLQISNAGNLSENSELAYYTLDDLMTYNDHDTHEDEASDQDPYLPLEDFSPSDDDR